MILYGQVKRQGDDSGTENTATTFPSAKMTVACSHEHGIEEEKSWEIVTSVLQIPKINSFNPLWGRFSLSSVPHLKPSMISCSRLWQYTSSQGIHLLQTMIPSLCHFRSSHLTATPHPNSKSHHFSNLPVITYTYINIDIIYTKDFRNFWYLKNPRSLFPTPKCSHFVTSFAMEVIQRMRLVHINPSRRISKLERDQGNMACPQPDLWAACAVYHTKPESWLHLFLADESFLFSRFSPPVAFVLSQHLSRDQQRQW